jgi:hypothetical protein
MGLRQGLRSGQHGYILRRQEAFVETLHILVVIQWHIHACR